MTIYEWTFAAATVALLVALVIRSDCRAIEEQFDREMAHYADALRDTLKGLNKEDSVEKG